jgi:hypothetical protein
MEQNGEMVPNGIRSMFLKSGPEQNFELFIICGKAGTGFRVFFAQRDRRNSDGLNQNFRLFVVPQNIFFSRKMATLVPTQVYI